MIRPRKNPNKLRKKSAIKGKMGAYNIPKISKQTK
jgi:hypothetical protein